MRWAVAMVVLLTACTVPDVPAASPSHTPGPGSLVATTAPEGSPAVTAEPTTTAPATFSQVPVPSTSPTHTSAPTAVPLQVVSLVDEVSTAQFRAAVRDVLTDPRGWEQAGFAFDLDDADAPYRLVLAEGPVVDELCLPLDTDGRYSCQNGPMVALNADRWRTATPSWPGTLEDYRTMLLNHEVGHLLHLHHPLPQCPAEGLPAPVMAQQSTTLEGCVANPWPLRWEIELAAQQAEPLAPPAEHDTRDHQPSPPPVTE